MPDTKLCFVIAQIGKPDSEEWKRTDKVFRHVIQPVVRDCGYDPKLANQIHEPGVITRQIIDRLMEAPLVVADLTGYNPNVFYELALRHVLRKPLVQMIQQGHRIPFDVVPVRTIQLNFPDPDGIEEGRRQLAEHIRAVEKDSSLVDNPISDAIDLRGLKASDKPADVQVARILEALGELRQEVAEMKQQLGRRGVDVAESLFPQGHMISSVPYSGTVNVVRRNLKSEGDDSRK